LSRKLVIFLALVLSLTLSGIARAQPASEDWGSLVPSTQPTELAGAILTEKKGDYVPADIQFTDDEGKPVTLGTYFNKNKPIILQLGYFACPMLCGTVHTDMFDAFLGIDLLPTDYTVLSISISPKEDWKQSNLKRQNISTMMLGRSVDDWRFLTGSFEEIQRLTNAVGFGYAFIKETGEYSHPAGLIFISPQGKITQYLGGLDYDQKVVRKAIVEAGQGSVGSLLEQAWLTCAVMFRGAAAKPLILLRAAATIMVLLIVVFYIILWFKMQIRKNRERQSLTPATR